MTANLRFYLLHNCENYRNIDFSVINKDPIQPLLCYFTSENIYIYWMALFHSQSLCYVIILNTKQKATSSDSMPPYLVLVHPYPGSPKEYSGMLGYQEESLFPTPLNLCHPSFQNLRISVQKKRKIKSNQLYLLQM